MPKPDRPRGARAAASLLLLLTLCLVLADTARAFVQLPSPQCPQGRPISAQSPLRLKPTCPATTRLAATTRRGGRGGGRMDGDEEEEEDELGDEVARIVGYGEEGRPLRRNRNQVLEWLQELYHKIFWFGLEGLAEDDDDYYLDEIDWLGEWNKPQEVGKEWADADADEEEALRAAYEKGGDGRLFRGAFPFDRQTYPPTTRQQQQQGRRRRRPSQGDSGEDEDEKEVVVRKVGEREETPVWRNVRSKASGRGGSSIAADEEEEEEGWAGGRGRPGRTAGGGSGKSPVRRLAVLEEQKQALAVSRELWKRRVAEALRETAGAGGGGGEAAAKLSRARARLQGVDQELEDVEMEIEELRLLLTAPTRTSAAVGAAEEDDDDDVDEEDEDSRI